MCQEEDSSYIVGKFWRMIDFLLTLLDTTITMVIMVSLNVNLMGEL